MGLGIMSGSSCSGDTPTSPVTSSLSPSRDLPNPNKFRWSLVSFDRCLNNNWCVVVLQYHDCMNHEGRKIMVYDDADRFQALMKTGAIDPHFDDQSYSPVARFEPTERGIMLAKVLATLGVK